MIVVADTGPINYFIASELLPRLYVRILIPDSVRDELQKDAAPKLVRQWIAKPPEWIRTPITAPNAELLRIRIGSGERDRFFC
jgi:predicted nucleic acid-binding protein